MIEGGTYEEAQENQSFKGSFEEEKCKALFEKIGRGKKVSNLNVRRLENMYPPHS